MLRTAVIACLLMLAAALPAGAESTMRPFGANDSSHYQLPDPVRPNIGGGRFLDSSGMPLSATEDYYVRWRVWNMYHGFGYGWFSRWTNNTVSQLGQFCLKIGINCNWLMALPAESMSSIVSMSPAELSALSGRVESMMRNTAGLSPRVLEVLRRESREFSGRLAAMSPDQRQQYLKEYAKPAK